MKSLAFLPVADSTFETCYLASVGDRVTDWPAACQAAPGGAGASGATSTQGCVGTAVAPVAAAVINIIVKA